MTIDRNALEPWFQPEHLDDDAPASYRTTLASLPPRMLVLHDLLVQEKAEHLARFLLDEADYETEYGIFSVEGGVSEPQYEGATEDDRFFRLSRLHGVPAEHQFSPN